MQNIEQQIEKVLDQIRPALQSDGGGIEFVKFDSESGIVYVRMRGACEGCPMLTLTLSGGIETTLKDAIPEVTQVKIYRRKFT